MDWNLFEKYYNSKDFNIGRYEEIKWTIENLGGTGKVLDVGCLDSELANLLVPYYEEVHGIDIRILDDSGKCKSKLYNFIVGDILNNPYIDNYFDEILFISSLEHIGLAAYSNTNIDKKGDIKALASCFRILKSKGKIIITIPFSDTQQGRFDTFGNMWERNYKLSDTQSLVENLFTIKQCITDNRILYLELEK